MFNFLSFFPKQITEVQLINFLIVYSFHRVLEQAPAHAQDGSPPEYLLRRDGEDFWLFDAGEADFPSSGPLFRLPEILAILMSHSWVGQALRWPWDSEEELHQPGATRRAAAASVMTLRPWKAYSQIGVSLSAWKPLLAVWNPAVLVGASGALGDVRSWWRWNWRRRQCLRLNWWQSAPAEDCGDVFPGCYCAGTL